MQLVFKKIPVIARYLYALGFLVLALCMTIYFYFPNLLDAVTLQQAFIAGAIIAALGSVINILHQFKPNKITLNKK